MTNFKKGASQNERMKKGVKVQWFDGHRKGTGVVVKPIMGNPVDIGTEKRNNGKPIYSGYAGEFEIRDDVTGEIKKFHYRDLKKIPSNRDIKKAEKR